MEELQQIKDEYTDYPTYLIVEQRRKALKTYKAIREKLADKKNNGKSKQLLVQLEGV
jgi:hypothetical protein